MLVTKNVVTREEVIAAVKELAGKLGRSPRYPELIRVLNVTRRQIHRMFGGWAGVLKESGCERIRLSGGELTMHELWHDWMEVARKAQRLPTIRQYEKFSKYSVRPLRDRFKEWERIPVALQEYGNARQLWAGWEDVKDLIERGLENGTGVKTCSTQGQTSTPCLGGQERRITGAPLPEVLDPNLLYAEPLNLSPLATAPQNEMGVVFVFGVMARQLGFVVLKIRPGFPDCIALRRLENGKWQWVRIELEFESRNFVLHGHDPAGCDLIVCWENNWPYCPLEVLELKNLFLGSPIIG